MSILRATSENTYVVIAGINNQTKTNWQPLTLLNGCTNFGGGNQTARSRRIGDIVYLEGLVKAVPIGTNTPFAELKAGDIPLNNHVFTTACDPVNNIPSSYTNISSNGKMTCSVGSSAYLSLDGIYFSVS